MQIEDPVDVCNPEIKDDDEQSITRGCIDRYSLQNMEVDQPR